MRFRPARIHTFIDYQRSEPAFCRSIDERHLDAVNGHEPIAPCGPHLLGTCCPTTIVGRIAAIVINAMQRLSLGARSHVRQKVLKAQPSVAHRDAAVTVVTVPRRIRVPASLQHSVPRRVCWRSATARVVAVRRASLRSQFVLEAAAAASLPAAQAARHNDTFTSALTPTGPISAPSAWSRSLGQHHQPPESSSRQVDECWHGPSIPHHYQKEEPAS